MAPTLYYLVGPPGSGKRTVGKHLAELTGAALLDNHLWNDPVFRAVGADGVRPLPPGVFALAEQVRQLGLTAMRLAPPDVSHILTNDLTALETGPGVLDSVRALATERSAAFVPVWLTCHVDELARRMPLPERAERLKLRDPGNCGNCWTGPERYLRPRTRWCWIPPPFPRWKRRGASRTLLGRGREATRQVAGTREVA